MTVRTRFPLAVETSNCSSSCGRLCAVRPSVRTEETVLFPRETRASCAVCMSLEGPAAVASWLPLGKNEATTCGPWGGMVADALRFEDALSSPAIADERASAPEPVIYTFAPVSRLLRGTPCRVSLARSSEELRGGLREAFSKSNAKILSLDVFDTFLLRDNRSEARRFHEISVRVLTTLRDRGVRGADRLSVNDLLVARADGMKLSYRTRPAVRDCIEGSLDEVVSMARRSLGLPQDADRIFVECELEYEASALSLNNSLADLAMEVRANGGRVILVSDMYLSGRHIVEILRKVAPDAESLVDAVFSSGDLVVSKRSGRIFREIQRRLEARPEDFFHVGDSLLGDVIKPREKGWAALHFPVSDVEATARAADLNSFILEMDEAGLLVRDWAKV